MGTYFIRKLNSSYEQIECSDKSIGSGGQGSVYKINSPVKYSNCCIKLYKGGKVVDIRKIEYMLRNIPSSLDCNRYRFCWPTAIVYNSKYEYVGYMMLLAFPGSEKFKVIEEYTYGKSLQELHPNDFLWHKFERNTPVGRINRMKLMCNWAIAVHYLHASGQYILGDIKPDNAFVSPDGRISIIDTDSFQITQNGRVLFPDPKGPMHTPEYFPRHGYYLLEHHLPLDINCDFFAMAVVFYKVFVGPHPYTGTVLRPPYDKIEQIYERIQAGLYAFGSKKAYFTFPARNFHTLYYNLPESIKKLFARAFSDDANIPTMKEWALCLQKEIETQEHAERARIEQERLRQQRIVRERQERERKERIKLERLNRLMQCLRITMYSVASVCIIGGLVWGIQSYQYHHSEYKALLHNAEEFLSQYKYNEAISALEDARVRKSSRKKQAEITKQISQVCADRTKKVAELRNEISNVWNAYFVNGSRQLNYKNIKYVEKKDVLPVIKNVQERIDLLKSITADSDEYANNTQRLQLLKKYFNC